MRDRLLHIEAEVKDVSDRKLLTQRLKFYAWTEKDYKWHECDCGCDWGKQQRQRLQSCSVLSVRPRQQTYDSKHEQISKCDCYDNCYDNLEIAWIGQRLETEVNYLMMCWVYSMLLLILGDSPLANTFRCGASQQPWWGWCNLNATSNKICSQSLHWDASCRLSANYHKPCESASSGGRAGSSLENPEDLRTSAQHLKLLVSWHNTAYVAQICVVEPAHPRCQQIPAGLRLWSEICICRTGPLALRGCGVRRGNKKMQTWITWCARRKNLLAPLRN